MTHEQHVRLWCGTNRAGRPVIEEVAAVREAEGVRLLSTPRLAVGAAAGDTLRLHADGRFEVTVRGGNLAFAVGADDASRDCSDLVSAVQELGGWLDARTESARHDSVLLVFTVPFRAGLFAHVEALVGDYTARVPGSQWYYINVYADSDGTIPLGWWEPAVER